MSEVQEIPGDDYAQTFLNIWALQYIKESDFKKEVQALINANSGLMSKGQSIVDAMPTGNSTMPPLPQLNWISSESHINLVLTNLTHDMADRFNEFQLFPLVLNYGTQLKQDAISKECTLHPRTLKRLVRASKDVAIKVIKNAGKKSLL